MTTEWEDVARGVWEKGQAEEERIAGYLDDFHAALHDAKSELTAEDRASVETILIRVEQPPGGLMGATPALYVVAVRAMLRLREMDDDEEKITLLGAALSLAFTAGQYADE